MSSSVSGELVVELDGLEGGQPAGADEVGGAEGKQLEDSLAGGLVGWPGLVEGGDWGVGLAAL